MKKILEIAIIILTIGLISSRSCAQDFSFYKKLIAGDREERDQFGYSVAVDGNYAIIGAFQEDDDENGGGDSFAQAGSAYIFEQGAHGEWFQVQKIVANDRSINDDFGVSVAISGEYAVIGAFEDDTDAENSNSLLNAGSAYVFERNMDGQWLQVQKLVPGDRQQQDEFGLSVGISGDYLIVGANSQDLDENGANSLTQAGAAYIFKRNGSGTWEQTQKLVNGDRQNSDFFGYSVAISGHLSIVGAPNEDHDKMGGAIAGNAGSVYIFERDEMTNQWSQIEKIVASDRDNEDMFGKVVAISGDLVVVGAHQEDHDLLGANQFTNSGAAYIFQPDAMGNWQQLQKIVSSDRATGDQFGFDVAVSADAIVIGAPFEDEDENGNNQELSAGSVYLFENDGADWVQTKKMVSPDRANSDQYGRAVAISGNILLGGARRETSDENGENHLIDAGSVYMSSRRQAQSINFTSFPKITFGDAPFDLSSVFSTTSGLTLSFVSNDETVATISGNLLTIITPGTINVTASQAGGSEFTAAADVSQQLIVNKADQTISFDEISDLDIFTQPFDLVATASSDLPVSFESSDESIVTISGTLLTVVKEGTATITALQEGNSNYNATSEAQEVEVLFVLEASKAPEQKINIFPNPTKNLLMVDIPNIRISKLSITDLNGKSVKFKKAGLGILNISNLKKGLYILEIYTTKGLIRKRFVKA